MASINCRLAALTVTAAMLSAATTSRADRAAAWGSGLLGDGTTTLSYSPIILSGLGGGVTAINAGNYHTLAIVDGAVYSWGDSAGGKLGIGEVPHTTMPSPVSGLTSGATAVAAGANHSLAIKDGSVYAFGYNYAGQLGDGTTTQRNTPVFVSGLPNGVTAIAAGGAHSLAIQNGTVYAWGNNSQGELGNDTTTSDNGISTPAPVIGLASGVTDIAASGGNSLAVKDGIAYAWGNNFYSQLGNGTSGGYSATPTSVSGLPGGVSAVASGNMHCLALVDGHVYEWGFDTLLNFLFPNVPPWVPKEVDPTHVNNIVAIAAGYRTSYALSSDGSLWAWGPGTSGALGIDPPPALGIPPKHLLPPAGYKFTSIDGGTNYAVATLRAVPEPSALVLAAGALGWCFARRHRRQCIILTVILVALFSGATNAIAVTIDMVTVGNPGNAPDTRYNDISVGSVDHVYQIGKYEITAGQYTEFLNAVADTDPNELYNIAMGDAAGPKNAKIVRTGSSPNFSYSVASDWAERPVNYVSFWDAARFANWLHNGQPEGGQGPGTTEDGAYHDVGDQTLFGRNASATFFIPTEDEWYKAAYHDKTAGLAPTYYDYPTGTNAVPGSDISETTNAGNNANYFISTYAIGSPYYRTPFGEFELSDSPYGTFDQGGNVWEWNETNVTSSSRGLRGGSFDDGSFLLSASFRFDFDPALEDNVGFRVASIAELAGDFNHDGRVDGRDFLAWQRGQSPDPLSGDNLAEWQAAYQSQSIAGIGVPEPGTLILAATALGACIVRRRTSKPRLPTNRRIPSAPSVVALVLGVIGVIFLGATSAHGATIRTVSLGSFRTPVINDAGQVAFGSTSRVRLEVSGGPVDVALSSTHAPGTPDGVNFFFVPPFGRPGLNNAGQVAFTAGLTGVGVNSTNNSGLWSGAPGSVSLVARRGDHAPGTAPGVNFGFISSYSQYSTPVLNSKGQTSFHAGLNGSGVEATNFYGIWSGAPGNVALVARAGDQAVGMPSGVSYLDFVQSSDCAYPTINDAGQTGFTACLTNYKSGIWLNDSTGTTPVVIASSVGDGDQAPGMPAGVTFSHFNFGDQVRVLLNNAGQTAFSALTGGGGLSYTDRIGIWSGSPGNLALVAHGGQQAPGTPSGVTFVIPEYNNKIVLNNAGQTAFRSQLVGDGVDFTNNAGIWVGTPGHLTLAVRSGSQAPGMSPGVNFESLGSNLVLNDAGQIAFWNSIHDGATLSSGIWATDRHGALHLVVRQGDQIEVAPGDVRTIAELNDFFSFFGPSAFNKRGQITFAATLVGGGAGIFVSNAVAIPEPSTWVLAAIGIALCTARCRRQSAVAIAVSITLLFGVLERSARAASIELGTNLIANPGAELGSTIENGVIRLTDWNVTSGPLGADGLTGVMWGQAGGFPTFFDPGPAPISSRGTYLFAGGNNEYSSAAQVVAGMTPEVQAAIDGGRVPFNLNGWLGGYTGPGDWQEDNARLSVRFLDTSNQVINTTAIGPVTNADRNSQTALLYREAIGFVPAGTRSIGIDLEMTRHGGSYNDGYADNLSLTLFPPLPPSAPTPYSFTNILDSSVPAPNGNYLNIRDAAVSGNRVAFTAGYNQGFLGDLDSIYISSGGPRAQVVERLGFAPNDDYSHSRPPEGGRLNTIGRPAIDGRVVYFDSQVFYPDFRYGTGIFFGDGTRDQNAPSIATALSPHAGPQFEAYQTVADPQISNRYIAYRKSSGENSALDTLRVLTPERTSSAFIAGVGSPTPLGGTFDWIDPNFDLSGPTVVFRGIVGSQEGIFTGAGGDLSTIIKKGDPTPVGGYFDSVLDPTITGSTVAFIGTYAGGSGIFTGDGGALATIVKTGDTTQDGKVFTGVSTPTLAFNMIAFRGEYAGGSGLYTKRGDELSKVVEIGDSLFGSTVTSFSFSDLGLDVGGSGNLAFTFGLADGRSGVAMATLDGGLPTIFQDAAGRVPVPDSVGITWVPAADFSGRNLTNAWLLATDLQNLNGRNVNLRNAVLRGADLTNADLSEADLRGAVLDTARLNGADLSGAQIRGARFGREYLAVLDSCWVIGCDPPIAVGYGGITSEQLSSTASYGAHDLSGVNLSGNDFSVLSLANQNLTGTNFNQAKLTDVDFSDAEIRRANFGRSPISATMSDCAYGRCTGWTSILGTGITLEQLASTRSYMAGDLNGISFQGNDLAGGNFANFNLTNTNFSAAELNDAIFTDAEVRGTNFSVDIDTPLNGTGITSAQLYSTASYQDRNLSEVSLEHNNLTQWNFAGQNLTNASLRGAALAGADFSEAEIRGAVLSGDARRVRYGDVFEGVVIRGIIVYGSGITPAQLYSTASYQAHDLRDVAFDFNDLSDANLAGQNLSNARFYGASLRGANLSRANLSGAAFGADDYARVGPISALPTSLDLLPADLSGANLAGANLTNANLSGLRLCDVQGCDEFLGANLTGANLSGADARGANFLLAVLQGAKTTNLIQPDGRIAGVDLTEGATLVVRDYDGNPAGAVAPQTGPLPVVVNQYMAMDATGTLELVFDSDNWGSTISFAPCIPVTLGGMLELAFAADVVIANQFGRTFKLFDWRDVTPAGSFTISSPYVWNLDKLYTSGEVTLVGTVPEPSTLLLIVSSFCLCVARRR